MLFLAISFLVIYNTTWDLKHLFDLIPTEEEKVISLLPRGNRWQGYVCTLMRQLCAFWSHSCWYIHVDSLRLKIYSLSLGSMNIRLQNAWWLAPRPKVQKNYTSTNLFQYNSIGGVKTITVGLVLDTLKIRKSYLQIYYSGSNIDIPFNQLLSLSSSHPHDISSNSSFVVPRWKSSIRIAHKKECQAQLSCLKTTANNHIWKLPSLTITHLRGTENTFSALYPRFIPGMHSS